MIDSVEWKILCKKKLMAEKEEEPKLFSTFASKPMTITKALYCDTWPHGSWRLGCGMSEVWHMAAVG